MARNPPLPAAGPVQGWTLFAGRGVSHRRFDHVTGKGAEKMKMKIIALVPAVLAGAVLLSAATAPSVAFAAQGSMNGAAGQMPAFYDGALFTVNMKEMPAGAEGSLLANNPSINTIYASNDLDEEQVFTPVIDAIQGDGFNPLWHQVLIVFNAGFTPHQFTSDEQVLAAAAGAHPEITLVVTDEVYRCAVVGPK
jgi:hypothetical protein